MFAKKGFKLWLILSLLVGMSTVGTFSGAPGVSFFLSSLREHITTGRQGLLAFGLVRAKTSLQRVSKCDLLVQKLTPNHPIRWQFLFLVWKI